MACMPTERALCVITDIPLSLPYAFLYTILEQRDKTNLNNYAIKEMSGLSFLKNPKQISLINSAWLVTICMPYIFLPSSYSLRNMPSDLSKKTCKIIT